MTALPPATGCSIANKPGRSGNEDSQHQGWRRAFRAMREGSGAMTVIPEFDRLRCLIDQATFNERHPNYDRWVFQRGWNAALQIVLEKMELIERDVEGCERE
jgi:hypothetical protein